jgi:hypothetical protein
MGSGNIVFVVLDRLLFLAFVPPHSPALLRVFCLFKPIKP